MEEYYIWYSSRIDLIFGTWKLFLRKLCRWHHSLYCCKQYSRSTRETIKYHAEALYWVFQQSNKTNLGGKCYLLLSTQEDANSQISNTTINCARSQKLLGIAFDTKLKFDMHIKNICQKANRKLMPWQEWQIIWNYLKGAF